MTMTMIMTTLTIVPNFVHDTNLILCPLRWVQFMTLRRLNLRIQGFPESYASEPYGDDMVVGEPHAHPPMTVNSASVSHGDMMRVGGDNDPTPLSSHDQVVGVLGSPIRSSPMTDDPISAT